MNELITAIKRYLGDREPGQTGGDLADVWRAIERAEAAPVVPADRVATPGTPEFWLRAALNCKAFVWDEDQREMAEGSLAAPMAPAKPLVQPLTDEQIHGMSSEWVYIRADSLIAAPAPVAHVNHRVAAVSADRNYWREVALHTQGLSSTACDDQFAPEPSPTAGMNIAQRILHVGGRNNAAGYVEFGSIQAVEALVLHALRDAK